MTYHSQEGQDRFLDTHVFKGFKYGTFVDVGAHDGRSLNNTLFFEETHGWMGINIEPIHSVFEQLCDARPKCINIECAVSETEGCGEFLCNHGYTEMISGLKEHYDPRHASRLEHENQTTDGCTETITVKTRRLDSILQEHGVTRVHYLSVDVEGAEFSVIKSINFDHVFIDVIGFENNYSDTSAPIVAFLQERGYTLLEYKGLDIMMIHKDSEFSS